MSTPSDRADAVEALFHAALTRLPAERPAFLAGATADADILAEVTRLLAADDAAGATPLVTGGVAEAAGALLAEADDRIGQRIGPYRIAERIGAGGMGVVYRADRTDVGAQVALKVLRDPLSPEASRRFLEERRVLAQLRHPAIATLFDVGTDAGAPWFAMEYVDGRPMLAHCREVGAGTRERLRLFRAVCEPVGHAHRQLVIHRDLKPSNVLVTSDGAVKLIDFGIATGLPGAVAETSPSLALTPAYAAPEQLRAEPATVQTDVFSLGVMLYELLTDRLPFDRGGPDGGPPRPPTASMPRSPDGVDPADLDLVCLTALAADPSRRYGSVEALLRDLDALGAERPVEARADSAGYRLRKLWRRRGRTIVVTGLVVAAAAVAAGLYTNGLARARLRSEAEARRAERLQGLLVGLLQGGDDTVGPADSVRVVTLVDRGAEQAATLTAEPRLQADLYETLGTIQRQLGRFDRADSLLTLSLERRRSLAGPDDPDLSRGLIALAHLRTDQARFPEADSLARAAIGILERASGATRRQRAGAHEALAEVEEQAGNYREAIAALERAITIAGPVTDTTAELASRWYSLANNYYYAGVRDTAELLNQRVLALWTRAYGEHHPLVADVVINLGAIEQDRGRYPEAERHYQRGTGIMERWYGPDHPRTAAAIAMLGRVALLQQQRDRADTLIRRALAIRRRVLGPHHPRVGLMLNELANIAFGRERLVEAESLFVAAIEAYQGAYRGPHQYRGAAESGLASVYLAKRDPLRAEAAARKAIATFEATLSADHLNTGIARVKLGRALIRQRRFNEAAPESRRGYETVKKEAGMSAPWVKGALGDLIELARATGDDAGRERYERELAGLPK